jgi:hypothetical protein
VTYWTEDRPESFLVKMAAVAGAHAGDVIACGHTHKPWHQIHDGVHFVNTGSVGRPKDGDGAQGSPRSTWDSLERESNSSGRVRRPEGHGRDQEQ